jgi:hypothetical protein
MIVCANVLCCLSVIRCHRGLVCQLLVCCWEGGSQSQTNGCDPVLISRRQKFVVPAVTYQRRIVQSRRGGNGVAVSRVQDRVVGVTGVPLGSRSRHFFIHSRICVRRLSPVAVDPGLRVQANRTVRPHPLVRNDLVRTRILASSRAWPPEVPEFLSRSVVSLVTAKAGPSEVE